jgi:hypothetical protein
LIRLSSITPHLATFGLLAAGFAVCASTAGSLASNKELRPPLNPFGINTSPYGEVLAMAMQGPVDVLWSNASRENSKTVLEIPPDAPLRERARIFIDEMDAAARDRTNPNPASKAQTRFLKREIENKLRFAYELDPGHYANYNTYHFFLTEPAVGTRRLLTREAAQLAEKTVRYCLSRRDDPRHALTAAAATENMLQLMFNDFHHSRPRFTTAQMREQLALLDHCLGRYHHLAGEWERTGNWTLLSEQRILECEQRLLFVTRMRETCLKTIERIEAGHSPATSGMASPSLQSS